MDKLNQWLTLGANLGVILGIIFLALEVQQNNELIASQNRFNAQQLVNEYTSVIVTTPDLSELMFALDSGDQPLTGAETMRVSQYFRGLFKSMEWSFLELPQEEIPLVAWQSQSSGRLHRMYWARLRETLNPDFVAYMEANTAIDGE